MSPTTLYHPAFRARGVFHRAFGVRVPAFIAALDTPSVKARFAAVAADCAEAERGRDAVSP